jgi:aldehyde:ferredoxin oxidoreductase
MGLVMECYEKGMINIEDTDMLEMTWGNAETTRAMLRKIANRDGFGDLLAEGTMRAAKAIGGEAPSLAIHTMKGNSPRGHDHRSLWQEMFDTCVSNTGTIESQRAINRTQFGLSERGEPFDPKDIVNLTTATKGAMQFEDSLGVCRFNTRTEIDHLCQAVNAATGWDFTFDDAMKVGRRTVNLLKAFNLQHGIGPELDKPSPRYGSTPVDGKVEGVGITEHWDQMVSEYYEGMGWDRKTSKPLPETLKALGLEPVVDDLWS